MCGEAFAVSPTSGIRGKQLSLKLRAFTSHVYRLARLFMDVVHKQKVEK